jgi:hypothetical protein
MDVKKELNRASSFHLFLQYRGCNSLFSEYEKCLTEVKDSNPLASQVAAAEHCTFPYMRYLSCVDTVERNTATKFSTFTNEIRTHEEHALKY